MKILDFFYPPYCQLCGNTRNLQFEGQLCVACAADIHINEPACRICAVPLTTAGITAGLTAESLADICMQCIKTPPVYDTSWSPFVYAQPLEWMIQQLKFNAKLNYAALLSALMQANLPRYIYEEARPDAIIPMPLHNRRLKQRGFNQSQLLIQPIAKALQLPLDLKSCLRIRDTEHQTGKSARHRQQNIKNAFEFINRKNYQHVVIFDDVVTTGSSVSELSRELKRAGVLRVDVWSLARAEKIN
ncbi:MAG: ComF family protein [Gammaproteobacteria bacterium]|nr:ComF family protein [Gammaproteobacteria bacterium]